MENEIQHLEEVSQFEIFEKNNIKIYSKKAIWGFSIVVTPIVGAILLTQNLRDIGKKKEANLILVGSIIFEVIVLIIVNLPEKPITAITYGINAGGGMVLTEYFYKKYFPVDEDFKKKKIWKPLIISASICIAVFLLIISGL